MATQAGLSLTLSETPEDTFSYGAARIILLLYTNWFSRYRVPSHKLEVETGRWTKPSKTPLENRKCKQCHVLEDEYQFMLECVYIKKYEKSILVGITGKGQIDLVRSENENILKR